MRFIHDEERKLPLLIECGGIIPFIQIKGVNTTNEYIDIKQYPDIPEELRTLYTFEVILDFKGKEVSLKRIDYLSSIHLRAVGKKYVHEFTWVPYGYRASPFLVKSDFELKDVFGITELESEDLATFFFDEYDFTFNHFNTNTNIEKTV